MDRFAGERPSHPLATSVAIEAGLDHEARGVEHLLRGRSRHVDMVVDAVDGPFGREARPLSFERTFAAMRTGAPLIVQGGLRATNWWGRPDLLEKVTGASVFGDWHYRALDYKSGSKLKRVHKLSVGYYALLLERVQGRRPEDSSILLSDEKVAVVSTSEQEPDVLNAVTALEEILGKGRDPGPFLTTVACGSCRWARNCHRDARAIGHLSLLPRITRPLGERLESWGYPTVKALSLVDPERLIGPLLPSIESATRLVNQARAQMRRRPIVSPGGLPPEREIEAFLDCETEGINDGSDAYLWGLLVRRGRRMSYTNFWAATEQGVGFQLRRLCASLMRLPEGVPVFHFGSFDGATLRKALERFGGDPGVLLKLVDLLPVLSRVVALPVKGQGLKSLAATLGYKRKSNLTGLASIGVRERWLETRSPALKLRLIRYNEDDVRALEYVLRQVRDRASRTAAR